MAMFGSDWNEPVQEEVNLHSHWKEEDKKEVNLMSHLKDDSEDYEFSILKHKE